MNCYNFSFQKSYTGFWALDNIEGSIPGILYLHDDSFEIELFFEAANTIRFEDITNAKGWAISKDEKENETKYRFLLSGLHLKKNTKFDQGIHTFLDVEGLFIYDEGYNFKQIESACVRTHLLDKWASKISKKAFVLTHSESIPQGHIELEFNPQGTLYLFQDNADFNIYIYFGWQQAFEGNNILLRTKNFLNIKFGSPIDLSEAFGKIESIKYFFYLIWNQSFSPDFIEFRSSSGNFILKLSPKYTYQYLEENHTSSPHTDIEDFVKLSDLENSDVNNTNSPLDDMFSKWFEIYDRYTDAIDTYFGTVSNKYISPSIKIKNYISTIDALSEEFRGPIIPMPSDSRNAVFLQSIFDKTEGLLSSADKQRLRDIVLKEKPTQLKPRFRKILEMLEGLIPDTIDNDFIEKIVNTRNNITHPKDRESVAFSPVEYGDAAYLLTKVIRAYLLQQLSVKAEIIKKIIEF